MKTLITVFSVCLLLMGQNLMAQNHGAVTYISHYDEPNHVKNHVLIDSITKTKFILDSSRIVITAIDTIGNKLWETDAWKDNKIPTYRFKRPLIVYFYLTDSNWAQIKNAIWITYNNTQFGTLDRSTGKFHFLGQD